MSKLFRRNMFSRYTAAAKNAIYFARCSALLRDATAIEPVDIVIGLLHRKHQSTCGFNELQERREEVAAAMIMPSLPEDAYTRCQSLHRHLPLSAASKRCLRVAWQEAKTARKFWIDDDDLQIGVLLEGGVAAQALEHVGFGLSTTRSIAELARKQWPLSKPKLRDRMRSWSPTSFMILGIVVGFLAINIFNLVRSHFNKYTHSQSAGLFVEIVMCA